MRYRMTRRMGRGLGGLVLFLTARSTLQPMWRKLDALLAGSMGLGTGAIPAHSGEPLVVKKLLPLIGGVVFDVGANVGQYASMILSVRPEVELHCFEPSPACQRALREAVGNRAHVHEIALSSTSGTKDLFGQPGSGLASLYNRRLDHFDWAEEESPVLVIQTTTLDGFCASNGIGRIDLLKLDAEGHELEILHGAQGMLQEGLVGAIQFEFGGCNIDSRTFFQDFWYMLSPKFRLFRVLPRGLWEIPSYSEQLERFSTSNYLAVLRQEVVGSGVLSSSKAPFGQ